MKLLSRGLVLLVLSLALGACHPGQFPFFSPRADALVGGEVPFALWVPPFARPVLHLDGERLARGDWERRRHGVVGTLRELAPGRHVLSAYFRVLFFIPVYGRVAFDVAAGADYEVRGSIGQVFVTRAEPDRELRLLGPQGEEVAVGRADEQGSLVFRDVPPGSGYRVTSHASPVRVSDPVRVRSFEGSTPDREFYESQVLEPGYGYITMRDGTRLSVYVQLPGPPEEGPYPTLVNYSGYEPSKPDNKLPIDIDGLDLSGLCADFPVICDPPNHPSGLIAGLLGYATVGVNMRGTGCSGGAYDFFEPLQLTDGYDLIEIIAAQDWVRNHKVGMIGISYPGISQLFTASMQPPSLAAITPLSVISGVDTTLAPGGIINNGFAIEWGKNVLEGADPYGQGWEQDRVDAGDTICEENQLLHSQKNDIIEKAYANPFYTPEVYDPLNPRSFVDRIEVPVFTAGAWQDEQTGGHFPDLWDRFTGTPLLRFTGYNGAHADGFQPEVLLEWKYFLDFYVAGEVREVPGLLQGLGSLLFGELFGAPVALPEHRFLGTGSFEEALAAYEAEPPGRILVESGGDPELAPGAPSPGFELQLSEWPPPGLAPERWYLHRDGSLRTFVPAEAESASTFQHDEEKGAETYEVDDPFERAVPDIEWLPWQPDRQVVFVSDPFAEDVVMLGPASADLWIRSSAEDADLEVMLSEVRPDGQESYVTSGWLRASQRALAPESTPLRPVPTRLEADAAPLPAGEWTLVRVEIYPFGHVFREGSRIRVSVSTPGGNKGRWKFDVLQFDEPVTHAVSHSSAHPSSLLLPVLPGIDVPTPLPPCPALRSQPCREYVPHVNALLE